MLSIVVKSWPSTTRAIKILDQLQSPRKEVIKLLNKVQTSAHASHYEREYRAGYILHQQDPGCKHNQEISTGIQSIYSINQRRHCQPHTRTNNLPSRCIRSLHHKPTLSTRYCILHPNASQQRNTTPTALKAPIPNPQNQCTIT